ncbi:MAG: hypothetical protein K8U03_20070 [Planctomycetia bacterium]|nr:hypothetical protein [Planctomycetia bacterium]
MEPLYGLDEIARSLGKEEAIRRLNRCEALFSRLFVNLFGNKPKYAVRIAAIAAAEFAISPANLRLSQGLSGWLR